MSRQPVFTACKKISYSHCGGGITVSQCNRSSSLTIRWLYFSQNTDIVLNKWIWKCDLHEDLSRVWRKRPLSIEIHTYRRSGTGLIRVSLKSPFLYSFQVRDSGECIHWFQLKVYTASMSMWRNHWVYFRRCTINNDKPYNSSLQYVWYRVQCEMVVVCISKCIKDYAYCAIRMPFMHKTSNHIPQKCICIWYILAQLSR